jgi:hypothetical protein
MGLAAEGIVTAVKGSIIVSFSLSIFFGAALGYLL